MKKLINSFKHILALSWALPSLICAQTHVQTTTLYQNTTATSISKAFASVSGSGNLIVVHLDWDGQTRDVSSVTDNKGNAYTRIIGPTNWNGTNYRAELWYAYNIIGGGTNITVKAILTGAPTSYSQIYISEYSGIATSNPLDQSSVAIGNTTTVSSGPKTRTHTNELIYGASIGASGALSVGASFNSRSTANQNIIEDKNDAGFGADSAKFSSAGGNWVAQMATFISTSSTTSLPIELSSFTGNCNNGNIELDWTTLTESNNAYFTIEQSGNGSDWQVMGTLPGAGNSSIAINYSFNAGSSNRETSYFRLKQTDFDGNFKYSDIIQVKNCASTPVSLNFYPNPSNGLSLSAKTDLPSNEGVKIFVYDNMGRMIEKFAFDQPAFTMSFQQKLSPGIYFIRFSAGSHSASSRFIVRY